MNLVMLELIKLWLLGRGRMLSVAVEFEPCFLCSVLFSDETLHCAMLQPRVAVVAIGHCLCV